MAKVGACISVRPLTRQCCYLIDDKLEDMLYMRHSQDRTHVSEQTFSRDALATRNLQLNHATSSSEVAVVSSVASVAV